MRLVPSKVNFGKLPDDTFISFSFIFQPVCCLQAVLVDESGQQIPGCYGSQVKSGDQSLSRPLSLHDAGENHFLVVDYQQHRVHLVTHQLQYVRHLVAKDAPGATSDERGITFPRHICLDNGVLYIGTYSGHIGMYRVQ